jgi:hypothetical protein
MPPRYWSKGERRFIKLLLSSQGPEDHAEDAAMEEPAARQLAT